MNDDNQKDNSDLEISESDKIEIIELSGQLLKDTRNSINKKAVLNIPISKLATLGAGVSSLIPAFNTVTQNSTFAMDGLYKVANAVPGQVLQMANDGNYYGSLRNAVNPPKMAKFAKVDEVSATTKSVSAFNPANIMIAASLYSIEKELVKIEETQKEILQFLEIEKESEIEGDIEALMEIIKNFKYTWDNNLELSNNHMAVKNIQKRARNNMIGYQKKVFNIVFKKKLIVNQNKVNNALFMLDKNFKYYRLSLYNYSLASMLEIMLSGNFKEEYIDSVKEEIENLSLTYRENFKKASIYIEKLSKASIEKYFLKGAGVFGKSVGDFIGSIPKVKDGQADEFLQDKGNKLKKNASRLEQKSVKAFTSVANPGTGIFVNKLADVIQIFNHTNQICFDKENIYLLS